MKLKIIILIAFGAMISTNFAGLRTLPDAETINRQLEHISLDPNIKQQLTQALANQEVTSKDHFFRIVDHTLASNSKTIIPSHLNIHNIAAGLMGEITMSNEESLIQRCTEMNCESLANNTDLISSLANTKITYGTLIMNIQVALQENRSKGYRERINHENKIFEALGINNLPD